MVDPREEEDFTLPHRFHVESMWSPDQSLESMWTLDIFFLVVAHANFLFRIHVESMWSPVGLQLLHLDNMDSTSEHREYEFTQQDSIWSPHGLIAFNCLMLFTI